MIVKVVSQPDIQVSRLKPSIVAFILQLIQLVIGCKQYNGNALDQKCVGLSLEHYIFPVI